MEFRTPQPPQNTFFGVVEGPLGEWSYFWFSCVREEVSPSMNYHWSMEARTAKSMGWEKALFLGIWIYDDLWVILLGPRFVFFFFLRSSWREIFSLAVHSRLFEMMTFVNVFFSPLWKPMPVECLGDHADLPMTGPGRFHWAMESCVPLHSAMFWWATAD